MLKTSMTVLLLGALLCGCPARQTKCLAAGVAGGDIKAAASGAPAGESLLKYIPAQVAGAALLRAGGLSLLNSLWEKNPQMKAELSAFLLRTVGADLTRMKGVAFYLTSWSGEAAVTFFLRMDAPPALKGKEMGVRHGRKLVHIAPNWLAASLPDGIALGNKAGLELAMDLSAGKGKPLDKASPLGRLTGADYRDAQILMAGDLSTMPQGKEDVAAMVHQYGVKSLVWSWDREQRVKVEALGDPNKLPLLKTLVMSLARGQLDKLKAAKDRLVAGGEILAGASSIAGYHMARQALDELEPVIKGGSLSASYKIPTIESPYYFTAVAGILAAVAIPAFVKYIRKSKTVEATESLDKIRNGAATYYAADQYTKQGKLKPKQFPPSSKGWTPEKTCCGQTADRCHSTAKDWDAPTWQALHFMMTEPHFYQYRFTSEGKGKDATFTVEARGDLDCDGKFSHFRYLGDISKEGAIRMRGPVIEDEIE